MPKVTINNFDDNGNVTGVGTDILYLSENAVDDIINHAAQLAIMLRDKGQVVLSPEANLVLANLIESLVTYDVII